MFALAATVAMAAPASAHQPVFLDERDPWPESGPLLIDGTISFAAYGTIDKPGATRGLSFNLKAGQPLLVELLIPDQTPETGRELPHITVLDPDGVPTDPTVTLGERFDESFSKTSYRRIAKVESTATKSGVWGAVVTGAVPARFTLVVGQRETRGEVERNDGVGSLATWWSTPPPEVVQASTTTAAPTTAAAPTSSTTAASTTGPTTSGPSTTAPSAPAPTIATSTSAPSSPAAAPKRRSGKAPFVVGAVVLIAISAFAAVRRRIILRGRTTD
jgi:hypothetical protein